MGDRVTTEAPVRPITRISLDEVDRLRGTALTLAFADEVSWDRERILVEGKEHLRAHLRNAGYPVVLDEISATVEHDATFLMDMARIRWCPPMENLMVSLEGGGASGRVVWVKHFLDPISLPVRTIVRANRLFPEELYVTACEPLIYTAQQYDLVQCRWIFRQDTKEVN